MAPFTRPAFRRPASTWPAWRPSSLTIVAAGVFALLFAAAALLSRSQRCSCWSAVLGPRAGSSTAVGRQACDQAAAGGKLEPLFLFIGILSGRNYVERRQSVREAWASRAQAPGQVVFKFVLSQDERTPEVQKELEAHSDMVFVKEKATDYGSILYKTLYVLEYGVRHYDVKFVLKTDDDAFVNVQPLLQQLRQLCETQGCARERLYMGTMAKQGPVVLQRGHKWDNTVYFNHTGLKAYPNYMIGGGYVLSGEASRILVDTHARIPLKFTPIEDATLGFWLMGMDLRHVDHPRFWSWAAPCCFKDPDKKKGESADAPLRMVEAFEWPLCSEDPWLVMHKIDSPTKMRYLGAKVAKCSYEKYAGVIAPSIQQFVPAEKLAEYRQWDPRALLGLPLGGGAAGDDQQEEAQEASRTAARSGRSAIS